MRHVIQIKPSENSSQKKTKNSEKSLLSPTKYGIL